MAQKKAAGTQVYISSASNSSANDNSAYALLAYTEIGEVISGPQNLGRLYEVIRTNTLGQRRTGKKKGNYDAGSFELSVYYDPTNGGQDVVETALTSDNEYAFKVDLGDESSGSPSNPTTFYFRGLVVGFTKTIPDAGNMVTGSIRIELVSDLVTADPV